MVHISFNVIGTAVCLILFYGGDMILHFTFLNQAGGGRGHRLRHTAFNVFTTILLLPFSRQLEKLARRLVRTEDTRESFAFLDPLLLRTPGAAVSESVAMAGRMGQAARENICLATDQLSQYSRERETQILRTRTSWTFTRTGSAATWWRSPSTGCPCRICAQFPACSTPSGTSSGSATMP